MHNWYLSIIEIAMLDDKFSLYLVILDNSCSIVIIILIVVGIIIGIRSICKFCLVELNLSCIIYNSNILFLPFDVIIVNKNLFAWRPIFWLLISHAVDKIHRILHITLLQVRGYSVFFQVVEQSYSFVFCVHSANQLK